MPLTFRSWLELIYDMPLVSSVSGFQSSLETVK